MLSFSTEFPLRAETTAENFLEAVKSWLLASPHTSFNRSDLDSAEVGNETSVSSGRNNFRLSGGAFNAECILAARYTTSEDDVDWVTEISFAKSKETWASVRTYRDSSVPAVHLPPAKKPVVVMTLLDRLGGGHDGGLEVSKNSYRLKNDEIELAGRLISGESSCYLPIVYVSATFDGTEYVNPDALARDLCGMAHVVVEPNRPFSQRLQIEVTSANAYGGAIGIYWPDGAGRLLLLPDRSLNFKERRQIVASEIRRALLNRRPLQWCSWTAAQQLSARISLESLKTSGSGAIDDYIKSFDTELKAKNQQLLEAEEEIIRLNAAIRAGNRATSSSSLGIKLVSEQDYFPGEIANIIRDAVAENISRVQANGRREHVLKAIISDNPSLSTPTESREKLKSIFRDYKTMTKDTRETLIEMGFSLSEDGKHYKAIYKSDDRYMFSIPKTSSDHRAGLNLASDIAKRIF